MIFDGALEYNQQWEAIANEGIGGPNPYVAPKVYTVIPASLTNPNLEVAISGSAYTDMMAATHRPLMPVFDPHNIYYSFEYNISTDTNAPTQIQALESEASYVYIDSNGISWEFPNDLQFNYEESTSAGAMVQGFTLDHPWLDTGIRVPKFTPNVPCPVKISYLVNTVKNTVSTLGIVVNGVSYAMPAVFQNVPALQKNAVPNIDTWEQGVYAQLQLDLAYAGGTVTNKYSGISINWE